MHKAQLNEICSLNRGCGAYRASRNMQLIWYVCSEYSAYTEFTEYTAYGAYTVYAIQSIRSIKHTAYVIQYTSISMSSPEWYLNTRNHCIVYQICQWCNEILDCIRYTQTKQCYMFPHMGLILNTRSELHTHTHRLSNVISNLHLDLDLKTLNTRN